MGTGPDMAMATGTDIQHMARGTVGAGAIIGSTTTGATDGAAGVSVVGTMMTVGAMDGTKGIGATGALVAASGTAAASRMAGSHTSEVLAKAAALRGEAVAAIEANHTN
jgi:hypothetical protein